MSHDKHEKLKLHEMTGEMSWRVGRFFLCFFLLYTTFCRNSFQNYSLCQLMDVTLTLRETKPVLLDGSLLGVFHIPFDEMRLDLVCIVLRIANAGLV